MRKSALGAVAALAAVLTVATSVAAAGGTAAAARQPDGRIRLQKIAYELFPTETYSRSWMGNNIYNTTGRNQAARGSWCCETPGWQQWTLGISVQNDGTNSDRIRVQATGTSLEGWVVKYYHGTTNITAAVVGGTFTTPLLTPGAEYAIKVKVRIDGSYDTLRRLISLTSVGDPGKSDAVKLVMRHVVCTC